MAWFHYAQINADGRCFASLSTHTPVDNPSCIEVPADPDSYVGRVYSDGVWSSA